MTRYQFIDDSGETRLAGTLQPDPGGSSSSPRVLGSFPFAFDEPGLTNGVAFYTPTIGDFLLDAWIEIDTAWNGLLPRGDVGQFLAGQTTGFFNSFAALYDLTLADASFFAGGQLLSGRPSNPVSLSQGVAGEGQGRFVPGRFLTADPLKVVVGSDAASIGGTDPGASQGAAGIYLIVATPSLT